MPEDSYVVNFFEQTFKGINDLMQFLQYINRSGEGVLPPSVPRPKAAEKEFIVRSIQHEAVMDMRDLARCRVLKFAVLADQITRIIRSTDSIKWVYGDSKCLIDIISRNRMRSLRGRFEQIKCEICKPTSRFIFDIVEHILYTIDQIYSILRRCKKKFTHVEISLIEPHLLKLQALYVQLAAVFPSPITIPSFKCKGRHLYGNWEQRNNSAVQEENVYVADTQFSRRSNSPEIIQTNSAYNNKVCQAPNALNEAFDHPSQLYSPPSQNSAHTQQDNNKSQRHSYQDQVFRQTTHNNMPPQNGIPTYNSVPAQNPMPTHKGMPTHNGNVEQYEIHDIHPRHSHSQYLSDYC
ncbi:hypothetical protein SNEBB_004729 [Seison nebaliae]|nr:hypothetical protein SNEBB_004729 [Seison nebaliae]